MELTDQELWDCKVVFREKLEQLALEFRDQVPFSNATKDKYYGVIYGMIDYVVGYTDHIDIKTVKPGDVVSRYYYQSCYDYDFPPAWKKYMLAFFIYLREQGYENQKVIRHLSRLH